MMKVWTHSVSALLSSLLLAAVGFPLKVANVAPAAAFVYPLMSPRISSTFGNRAHPIHHVVRHHHGIDLAAPQGAPIRAIGSGLVVFADPYAGYGNLVVVQHKSGVTSHYGHCNSIKVKTGQFVKAGAVLGTVGSTGITTGPHLHFEIRRNGQPLDPEKVLPGLADDAAG